MSRGRHRRPRSPLTTRQVSRLSLALTASGAAVAAPLVTAGSAHAAAPAAVSGKVAGQAHTQAHTQTSAQAHSQVQAGARTGSQAAAEDPYTVVSGDTLHNIATAHDIKGGWSALYEANQETVGGNPDLIYPGQELTLAAQQTSAKKSGASERSTADQAADRSSADRGDYADNLDGWIREALSIMQANGIPGSYDGIHRNIMRESGGDPSAINNWDINAQNGTPSIGLLQVIKPTFDAYHVAGTANDQYDPVANIVTACNYAADQYGSIDNVNGPY